MLKPFLTLAALCVAFTSCNRSVKEPEAEVPSVFTISETESSAIAQPASWGEAKVSVRCVDEKVIVKHTPVSGEGEYVAVFGKKGHEYFHVIEAEDRSGAPQGSDPEWGAYYDIDGDGYADFRKKHSASIYEKRTDENWAAVDESEFREARSLWTEFLKKPSNEKGQVWTFQKDDGLEMFAVSPESWRRAGSTQYYVTLIWREERFVMQHCDLSPEGDRESLWISLYPIFKGLLGQEGLYGFEVFLSPGKGAAIYRDYTGDGYADFGYCDGVYKMREGSLWKESDHEQVGEAHKKMVSKKGR